MPEELIIAPNMEAALSEFLAFAGAGPLAMDLECLTLAARAPGGNAKTEGGVAVIPVHGPLAPRGFSSFLFGSVMGMDNLRSMLADAADNKMVGTIVLDIDSPGGTVDGTPETAAAVASAAAKKKVIAVANTLAASAAYWLGSQASEIVMSPSARVGSIGVMGMHRDMSKALASAGINVTLVTSPRGGFKAERSPFAPLTPEALGAMQAESDAAYAQFVRDVAQGRRATQTKVREEYGRGRTVSAQAALTSGMADRVATLDDVISGAASGKPSAPRPRRSSLPFS